MQIENILLIPELSAQMFIILSIVSLLIGICIIIFGLVRQKKPKGTLATGSIVIGSLIIISQTIQIVVRVLSEGGDIKAHKFVGKLTKCIVKGIKKSVLRRIGSTASGLFPIKREHYTMKRDRGIKPSIRLG